MAQSIEFPWAQCKERLRSHIPDSFFESCIEPIESQLERDQLVLSVPGDRLHRHVSVRYSALIENTLRELQFQGPVSLIKRTAAAERAPQHSAKQSNSPAPVESSQAAHREPESSRTLGAPAPAPYFPPSTPNSAQPIALLQTLQFPAPTAVLLGSTGVGKTVLARQLVAQAEARGQAARYLTLESFITDFALACSERTVLDWRNDLRSHELLVIDDFQFIKKTATKSQEELRLIIDEFEARGAKVVFCSDIDLRRLPIRKDLLSRLFLSLRVELQAPEAEQRHAILEHHLGAGMDGAEDLVAELARRISGDGRKLMSAAQRLLAFQPQCRETMQQVMADLYDSAPARLDADKIIRCVAEFLDVSTSGIRGPARDRKYTLARHLSAYLCHDLLGMKLTDIAAAIGRKEHGSVIHARNKIRAKMKTDLFFERQVAELSERLLA